MRAPYQHVAGCVDGSPADAQVMREAGALAGAGTGARLTAVHVAEVPTQLGDGTDASFIGLTMPPDPEPFLAAARGRLERASALAEGADALLLDGRDPAQAVCDWAAEAGVDLIVAGAHGGLLERLSLGRFAGRVAHDAPCPVLLVRPIRTG